MIAADFAETMEMSHKDCLRTVLLRAFGLWNITRKDENTPLRNGCSIGNYTTSRVIRQLKILEVASTS